MTQRRSGITAYENKVLTSSSPTLLDAEAKVGAIYGSGPYMMSLLFIFFIFIFSMGELKWNTLRKPSIPTSFLPTIKLRTFNLRLILSYNLPKGCNFFFLNEIANVLIRGQEGGGILYLEDLCLSPEQRWIMHDDFFFFFLASVQVPLLASEPPSTWTFHLLLGIPCVLLKQHYSESMLSHLNIAWHIKANSSYLKLCWSVCMKSILVRRVRTEGCSI